MTASDKVPNTAKEISALLRDDITTGQLPAGSRLPAVRTLAERYGVSRNTITKALAALQNAGLVVTRHGSGAYVREQYPIRILGPDRYARSKWQVTTVEAHSDEPHGGTTTQQGGQTQDVATATADDLIAEALDIDIGTPVYVRSRLVTRDGHPTHTMTSYYRHDDVAGTALVDPRPGIAGQGGGFAVLTEQGLPPARIREDKFARMPTTEEALTLEMPPGEPVMVLHRITYTEQGRPIEYAVGIHRASRFVWTNTYDIPE